MLIIVYKWCTGSVYPSGHHMGRSTGNHEGVRRTAGTHSVTNDPAAVDGSSLQRKWRSFILNPMSINADTIWLEINLGAIRRNVQRLGRIAGKPVMAVVKANAYGHGLVEVSHAALEGGASRLCVARFEEALALRQAGVEASIW